MRFRITFNLRRGGRSEHDFDAPSIKRAMEIYHEFRASHANFDYKLFQIDAEGKVIGKALAMNEA